MVRDIMHDELFLSQPSEPAEKTDSSTAQDLMDTVQAHRSGCVGMAANMIGVRKKIIVYLDGEDFHIMYNPEIIDRSGRFETEEGCLSLTGTRPCTRYRAIKVRFQDERWKKREKLFTGWTAQIIQHETDHLSGILI